MPVECFEGLWELYDDGDGVLSLWELRRMLRELLEMRIQEAERPGRTRFEASDGQERLENQVNTTENHLKKKRWKTVENHRKP